MRRFETWRALLGLLAASGCNQLLNIEDHDVVEVNTGGSAGQGTGGSAGRVASAGTAGAGRAGHGGTTGGAGGMAELAGADPGGADNAGGTAGTTVHTGGGDAGADGGSGEGGNGDGGSATGGNGGTGGSGTGGCGNTQQACGNTCIPATGCCAPTDCPATATCSANACVCNAGYYGESCNVYFKGLGFGASTHTSGQVNGLSADGTVAVGASRGPTTVTRAVRWVGEVGGLIPLLPDGVEAVATAVNSDGAVIVGDSSISDSNAVVAFRFSGTASTALQLLPFAQYSHATAINANGTVIVGWGDSDGGEFRGLRWTNGTVGSLGSIDPITPLAVSSNGQVVIGQQGSLAQMGTMGTVRYVTSIGGAAMRWTSGFALLDGGGVATAVSSDGNIVAGYTGARATRWNVSAPQDLGAGVAYAISGDGSVVVGASNSLAMIWDATNGLRSLPTVLTAAGVDLTGWTLRAATGISSNGKVIVGNGMHGSSEEPWIVRLP